MSSNLHKSETLSSTADCNNNLPKYNTLPNYRRTQSDFYSTQSDSTLNSRVKSIRRRTTTGSFYDKSSTTLFWDLVGLRSSPTSITSTFLGIDKNTQKNSAPSVPQQEQEPKKSLMTPIELRGRKADTDPVLDIDMAEQIRQQLPRRVRLAPSWNLLYSLDQDGTSMTTMYHKVKDKGPLIVVIKDTDEQVFGAFVSESLKQRPSYYGSGECFLWKYAKEGETLPPIVKFYKWTGRNEYMILSEHDYLAIGGGDGRTGLWVDSDLERGSSVRCDTFDNEVLSSTPDFDCMVNYLTKVPIVFCRLNLFYFDHVSVNDSSFESLIFPILAVLALIAAPMEAEFPPFLSPFILQT
ncbi:TLD-domain-containing protein [Rhizophagus clarus]|uniref:Oxidation resistance protein 1 n=1 Tax=Rhizophagus clarus TaxID=94130 RepID=A0A8H3LMD0_9GLOM|nr:TLD-domain-containing protein [Rhizophagus clarus]